MPAIAALTEELDQTYRAVIERLPENPAVRFEQVGGRNDLILSHLDKLDEPASLIASRRAVDARLPAVDLPEIILEIAARTGFAAAFTHISERASRASDLDLSLCAVLLAEACNIGLEPLTRSEDIAHLNPHVHDHVNMLGRYSFSIPESVSRGELRPLRNPADPAP